RSVSTTALYTPSLHDALPICDIRFFDVDFGYTPEKTVLHDINLYGLPGQKIAFVGSTGAGKTTITNLINRFYDIQDGKIRYDGRSEEHTSELQSRFDLVCRPL